MEARLPPVCTAQQIAAAYHTGLRIVWDDNGRRVTWQVVAVDGLSVTTRFTDDAGAESQHTATFEELSSHSSFPVGTATVREEFVTPAGSFFGTHVTVADPEGDQEFFFADDYPGPPIIIRSPGYLNQQVERSDLAQ